MTNQCIYCYGDTTEQDRKGNAVCISCLVEIQNALPKEVCEMCGEDNETLDGLCRQCNPDSHTLAEQELEQELWEG